MAESQHKEPGDLPSSDIKAVMDVTPSPSLPGIYRKELPLGQIPFSSAEGKKVFKEALLDGTMAGYFRLAEQFHTQSEPAYCGLGTLAMILNALGVDPMKLWKTPWRWYSEDLLDCCLPLEIIKKSGVTVKQFSCLAACNGSLCETHYASESTEAAFRSAVLSCTTSDERVLAVSYSRAVLGQTGDGHFSPIGGYHRERDLVLIMDVARFKYPPHWVPLHMLWNAMLPKDLSTELTRGFFILTKDPRHSSFHPSLLCAANCNPSKSDQTAPLIDGSHQCDCRREGLGNQTN